MKYRSLTDSELAHLDEELKQFLIVHGVHGDEWETLNRKNPDKARDLVAMFSDTVFQKVYEKIRYIEFRSADSCTAFHCMPDKMEVIIIRKKPDSPADLSTPESIHNALILQLNSLEFFKAEKNYEKNREQEIHELLENGCVISDVEFFESLRRLIQSV